MDIPEHPGKFRNILEHQKLKQIIIIMRKICKLNGEITKKIIKTKKSY